MKERILAIEDDVRVLGMLKKRLEFLGYEVITAQDGNDGLRLARTENPDLIVLDLILPGLNGYEVCAMLKGDRQRRDIPIIMLTARSQEKDAAEGKRVGADAYVTKPYDPDEFAAQVKLLLEQAEERRALREEESAAMVTKADIESTLQNAGVEVLKNTLGAQGGFVFQLAGMTSERYPGRLDAILAGLRCARELGDLCRHYHGYGSMTAADAETEESAETGRVPGSRTAAKGRRSGPK
jgi:CheY-like chemotaxis protein